MITRSLLLSLFLLVEIVILCIIMLKLWFERSNWPRRELLGKGLQDRLTQRFIIGTDSDLKVEFVYFLLLALLGWTAALFGSRVLPLLILVSFLQGLHFRQWLSRWRLRNIVSLEILERDRMFYWRLSELGALLLNGAVLYCTLSIDVRYALPSAMGLLANEIVLERKKRLLILKRKLYIFDVDVFYSNSSVRTRLIAAIKKHRLGQIDALIRETKDPSEALLLKAFKLLVTNSLQDFHHLYRENKEAISADSRLAYYFGKSLYNLGSLTEAKEVLEHGCTRLGDSLCLAYYALCVLSESRDEETVRRVLTLLQGSLQEGPEAKRDMFLRAFYALALAISTAKYSEQRSERLSYALFNIHEAMRINQLFFEKNELRGLRTEYFHANDQVFLDILGYIVFRQGNLQLSARLLQAAISTDNTYPWPYFHLALIYDKIGRRRLARSLLFRIAVNETSDSVLKRLCQDRLAKMSPGAADISVTGDLSSEDEGGFLAQVRSVLPVRNVSLEVYRSAEPVSGASVIADVLTWTTVLKASAVVFFSQLTKNTADEVWEKREELLRMLRTSTGRPLLALAKAFAEINKMNTNGSVGLPYPERFWGTVMPIRSTNEVEAAWLLANFVLNAEALRAEVKKLVRSGVKPATGFFITVSTDGEVSLSWNEIEGEKTHRFGR